MKGLQMEKKAKLESRVIKLLEGNTKGGRGEE
jgi:hypothetical protein